MRIKFGNRIWACTLFTHSEGSHILLATTTNGVYVIDMVTCEQAESAHNSMLVNGFFDASAYEYSN